MPIPYRKVVGVLREAIQGETTVRLAQDIGWDEMYTGDVPFYFGSWLLTFFNDADSLDYLDEAVSPDGDTGEFYEWKTEHGREVDDEMIVFNPIDVLDSDERDVLEELLKNAKPT